MSDTPELVFPAAEPVQDVCVEVIAELAPAAELPNVSAETAADSAPATTAAPAVGVSDLHHIHTGFLQVSVREGVARLEALIARLEA
jgi:hypothetical protein